jgi:hypothetical protein
MAQIVRLDSIDELVDVIEEYCRLAKVEKASAKKREETRLASGVLLLELRKRIEAGEGGNFTWWEWYKNNLTSVRSRRDAERLIALVSEDDPVAAAEEERKKKRTAMRALREQRAGETAQVLDFTTATHTGNVGRKPKVVPDPVEQIWQSIAQRIAELSSAQKQRLIAAILAGELR